MKKTLILMTVLTLGVGAWAATTINADNKYAYGANIGWINCQGDVTNGAIIGEYTCSGYLYGANVGWINLGVGTPTNGIRYCNTSATDFGVNHDRLGNLSGYAYGANIGWINFETNYGKPTVNLLTGTLGGYVWGANVGWISLSNLQAYVQTDTLRPGVDTNGNGIPDDWELEETGNLGTLTAGGDYDNDGVKDPDEYRSDTDPLSDIDNLRVAAYRASSGGRTSEVTWTTKPTRFYAVEKSTAMGNSAAWTDSGLGTMSPDVGTTMEREIADTTVTTRYFRVKAIQPLAP